MATAKGEPARPSTTRAQTVPDHTPISGHESSEGLLLAALPSAPEPAAPCDSSAPLRRYDIAAINVDITYNRYLDHDPEGRMYVLEQNLSKVRSEEATNQRARHAQGDPAVSAGLAGDAIQPLTLRVHQGECLRIVLRNALTHNEPVSLHLHGSGLHLAGGGPAIASNPDAMVRPGQTATYEWMVAGSEPEGTHYFHSHGDDRYQTGHGLFGAVIVEPNGSRWMDATRRGEAPTGWAAMIQPTSGSAFREFVLYYHEVGDENFQLLAHNDQFVPQVDPITHSYRPDGRALNYRSEPFMNRLQLQQQSGVTPDDSLEYSSYAFGDPATPLMRSYLGDPVKQRVLHAGGEVLHVHHTHGGAVRWMRQPGTERMNFDSGLDKHPPLHPPVSERTDSQTLGPSETFDIENECGSGGCQQSAGDFMYHCHVTEHYFSGMWGIWRVYNTRQDGRNSTDTLPPLLELPGRERRVQPAVTSDALIGRTLDAYGQTTTIDAAHLTPWVQQQLPPRGVPRGYDASVLDWVRDGDVYRGEPESADIWPGYRSPTPGSRPALLFDPVTGRLAYPFLHPHLGKRPPFAPNHGPAPFLDPVSQGIDPPAPGANGPGSECPAGTRLKQLAINAITLPITLNHRDDLVDSNGELYVLRDHEDAVRADPKLRVPLTLRANASEDCLDITLRSELEDTGNDPFNKVGMHTHFVQFDVQGSDGVNTGFNYEQTVRPFRADGETLTSSVAAGATSIPVTGTSRFQPGTLVGVGVDQSSTFEVATVSGEDAQSLTVAAPLKYSHGSGEVVSTEFVRYRWYPDAQFGTAFFHDHTNVLESSKHGLFGGLVSEPPGSEYHDPHTGAPVESGLAADIHTQAALSADVKGSFREQLLFLQDDNPITHSGRSSGSSLNLRADPPQDRSSDPSRRFSSYGSGDPETSVLEANVGDPVVFRCLVGANNEVHTIHLDGHWFRREPWSRASAPTSTVNIGISERYDLAVPKAGGPQQMPGDYLFYAGRTVKLLEGSWGILRVHGPGEPSPPRALPGVLPAQQANAPPSDEQRPTATLPLQPLPGHSPQPRPPTSVCPREAPRKRFSIAAVDMPLPMLKGQVGKLYVSEADVSAVRSGQQSPQPLVLHVGVGDCIEVSLRNATKAGPVSFHADMLGADPRTSAGVAAGNDPPQAVDPGHTRTYTLYASPEVGETTAMVRDWADVLRNPGLGLYGAIIVGPKGATYTDPQSGADVSSGSDWAVDVHPPGASAYRDASLFFQDEDAGIGTHRMPYTQNVDGPVGLNYHSEPLAPRSNSSRDTPSLARRLTQGDPATPLLKAYPGDPVTVHVLAPWSEQAQVFSIEGHRWRLDPQMAGSSLISSIRFGGLEALTLSLDGGAAPPGDYVYGDHRAPYMEAGLWGYLRVYSSCNGALNPLERGCPGASSITSVVAPTALAVVVLAAAIVVYVRRRDVKERIPSWAQRWTHR